MTSSLQHVLLYFHHLFYLGGGFKIWDYLSLCLFFFFQSFLICHLYVSCKHRHVHMHNGNLNTGTGMERYIYISLSLCALIGFKLWLQC